jgi:hypothetical protein
MTQLRHCKCGISNYFDTVLKGLGHRGSSFMDIDAVSHDGKTHRFLLQEFKQQGEAMTPAQHWMLRDVSCLPKWFTVWIIVKRSDGLIGFGQYARSLELPPIVPIALEEYQERFAAWWDSKAMPPPKPQPVQIQPVHPVPTEMVSVDEIKW